jgi:integrase
MTSTALVDPLSSVRRYLEASSSDATKKAYATDWADFTTWCEASAEPSLPATPIAVGRYLASQADNGLKVSTIERRAAAIAFVHRAAGHEPPTNADGVKSVMKGIRRTIGRRVNRKAPATDLVIVGMLRKMPADLAGLRDKAILLLGFASALRRSELVALDVADLDFRENGLLVHIGKSKTDQEGAGADIPVPNGRKLKPVAALLAWLKAAAITEGPIFRPIHRSGSVAPERLTDRSIARIVKKAAAGAGLDETVFSGHSMRAGFVTSALGKKVDPFKIMAITRHVKVDTLKIYDRRENGFEDHAGDGFL